MQNVQTDTLGYLKHYARAIGLAFQVQDDVLDITADTITLGKPAGSDEKLEKSTYVKLLGVKVLKSTPINCLRKPDHRLNIGVITTYCFKSQIGSKQENFDA